MAAPLSGTVLFVGKTLLLPIAVFDQNKAAMEVSSANVVWVSSDPLIASVTSTGALDGSGIVTGVSEGNAEISANIIGGTRAIATPPIPISVVKQVPTAAEIKLLAPPAAAKAA